MDVAGLCPTVRQVPLTVLQSRQRGRRMEMTRIDGLARTATLFVQARRRGKLVRRRIKRLGVLCFSPGLAIVTSPQSILLLPPHSSRPAAHFCNTIFALALTMKSSFLSLALTAGVAVAAPALNVERQLQPITLNVSKSLRNTANKVLTRHTRASTSPSSRVLSPAT